MLGQILVTKQTGPQGKVVSKVYLCEKLSLVNEMYFAITLDRLDYKQATRLNLQPKLADLKEMEILKWNKPVGGMLKHNCDGDSDQEGQSGGGAVIRNENGDLVAAAPWYYGRNSAFAAEILAVQDGLRLVHDLRISDAKIMLEVDSLMLVKNLYLSSSPVWAQQRNWKEILSRIRSINSVLHVCRELNVVADLLAKRGRIMKKAETFWSPNSLPKKIAGAIFWEKHDLVYIKRRK